MVSVKLKCGEKILILNRQKIRNSIGRIFTRFTAQYYIITMVIEVYFFVLPLSLSLRFLETRKETKKIIIKYKRFEKYSKVKRILLILTSQKKMIFIFRG